MAAHVIHAANAGRGTDDTAAFKRIMKNHYETLENFQADFRQFQQLTSTSFYIYNACTAKQWYKECKRKLPEDVAYKFVKYCCVYQKRKGAQGRRYGNYNCEEFVVVLYVDTGLRIAKLSVVHSHSFHVGNGDIYVRNRRLTDDQEGHLYSLMDTFKNTRELRLYAARHFGRMLQSEDIRSIRLRWQQKEMKNEAQRVSDLLKVHGRCRLTYIEGTVRFVFFVPEATRGLVADYGDVILADATHQLNYGGYVLWHVMFVDVTGVGRSFFYALMPNESGTSYKNALEYLVEAVPAVRNCKTVVVDRSLAQYNAFRQYVPHAKVVFCRFHVLRDMKKRCGQLVAVTTSDKRRIYQWMRNMVYAETEVQFNRFLAAIGGRSKEALSYLNRAWLPYKEMWAGYLLKNSFLLGNFTTNRVETENRHLKTGLSQKSTVFQVCSKIVDRVLCMDRQRSSVMAKQQLGVVKVPSKFAWLKECLLQLSCYARSLLLRHLSSQKIKDVRYLGRCWVVSTVSGRKFKVSMDEDPKCDCSFISNWHLPCAHLLKVSVLIRYHIPRLFIGNRWLISQKKGNMLHHAECFSEVNAVTVSDAVTSKSEKLRLGEDVAKDIVIALASLGESNFRRQLDSLRSLAEAIGKWPNMEIMGQLPGSSTSIKMSTASFKRKSEAPATSSSVDLDVDLDAHVDGNSNHKFVKPQTSGSRRKSALNVRQTEGRDIEVIGDPLQQVQFRRFRTTTAGTYRPEKRRRTDPPSPINPRVCYVCRREDDDEEQPVVQWIQCPECDAWLHYTCAGYKDEEDFVCVRCTQC